MLQLSNAGLPITAELSSFFGNAAITNRFINYDEKDEQDKLKKFAKDNEIKFEDIEANISAEIQEFEDIVARNNNVNTSKAIAKLHNIKKVLAYDVLNSMWVDGNLDQSKAEEKAASLINDHFVIEKTFYVPTIYDGEDISHTIESDTGIIAKADLIQKHYLDEFNAVAFGSEDEGVGEVKLTKDHLEQMEDNGEWRNTADGNGLIFGIVFPDGSFAPVKNADGEFLTFNFDDTSLTLPGTNIELEYSKQIESEMSAAFAGGNYASRNIVAMNEAMEVEKKIKSNEFDDSWRQNEVIKEIIKEEPIIEKIIMAESSGNANTPDSPDGARGLMQIMKNTAEQDTGFGVNYNLTYEELFDPEKNVKYGAAYYKGLKKYYGNDREALIAYNWGHGNYQSFKKLGYWIETKGKKKIKNYKLPEETRNYLKKILG